MSKKTPKEVKITVCPPAYAQGYLPVDRLEVTDIEEIAFPEFAEKDWYDE